MNKDQLDFATYCIGLLAIYLHRSQKDIFNLLEKSGILMGYIVPGYEVLHTFSRRYLAEDLTSYMREKGVLA